MSLKDWAVPLVAAAITFAGLSALPDPSDPAAHAADDGVDFAFPANPRVATVNHTARVILLSQDPQPVAEPWKTPHIAVLESGTSIALCTHYFPCRATHEVAAPGEPRLGVDGYNATRVTVHVFDAAGELVFSNGNASEQSRLVHKLTPEQLPTGTWYLGRNATAPAGTQRLPGFAGAFVNQLRPLIVGLPEGGVATTQTDALATLYGPLFVTMRVDELVHAP